VGLKVFTTMFPDSCETLQCIRQTLPDTITVIGGPHPSTSRPEDLFIEYNGLLDFAIAGDGEPGMVALIEKIRIAPSRVCTAHRYQIGGRCPPYAMLADIPGLIYRYGGEVRSNPPCLDLDLDALPAPDWSLQQPEWFGTAHALDEVSIGALVMDSRGCPGKCGYCMCAHINGSRPRYRSLSLLCAEIQELAQKYGIRALIFSGNSFLSDVNYVRELCHWFIKFDIPLSWSCTGAAFERNLKDPDLLALMRRAGCVQIYFGIESANPQVRKRLRQPLRIEEYSEIVRLTREADIRADGYFMFGFPDETPDEMEDTLRYAFSQPFSSVNFTICLPLPGTTSYEAVLKQQGINRIDWRSYDFSNPQLLPCKASVRQVRRILFKAKLLKRCAVARWLYQLRHKVTFT
jgi:radical SAM superfamily enzyme YgiQ (UPF0313 family)